MTRLATILVIICGVLLVLGTADLPDWGDPNSPAATHVSPYYIEHTLPDTSVPNVVTSVLADYRGFDTMFETSVVFTAALAVFTLLRLFGRRESGVVTYRHKASGVVVQVRGGRKGPTREKFFERIDNIWTPQDLVITTACRLLIPFIQLFALYVIAHGHHSPGGGFQGGVILGASVALLAIAFNLRTADERMPEKFTGAAAPAGVFIYAGVGAVCLGYGFNFLNYAGLASPLGVDPVSARSLGILFVETGVALAVMSAMIIIYANLASAGKYDEGL